jgi:dimethylargininase
VQNATGHNSLFTGAIVRVPCKRLTEGLTSANMGKPDYKRALQQHQIYIEALKYCGLEVVILPADERYPDSTFVEDTALLTSQCAVITNPGAESRRGETAIIKEAVTGLFDTIETITPPGTVDAGDIMMAGSTFYIGLSDRTNNEGASQMIGILQRYGMKAISVDMNNMLHLKTGLSYIENNNLLVTGELLDKPEFQQFNQIKVSRTEAYAANSVWINDRVLVPRSFPKTKALIESAGYETIVIETSEFRKIDGGLSCLSLRF